MVLKTPKKSKELCSAPSLLPLKILMPLFLFFLIPKRVIQTPPAKFNNPVDSTATPPFLLPTMLLQASSLAKHSQTQFGAKSVIKPTTAWMFLSRRTKVWERERLHTSLVWRMYLVLQESISWGDTGNLLFCQYLLFWFNNLQNLQSICRTAATFFTQPHLTFKHFNFQVKSLSYW